VIAKRFVIIPPHGIEIAFHHSNVSLIDTTIPPRGFILFAARGFMISSPGRSYRYNTAARALFVPRTNKPIKQVGCRAYLHHASECNGPPALGLLVGYSPFVDACTSIAIYAVFVRFSSNYDTPINERAQLAVFPLCVMGFSDLDEVIYAANEPHFGVDQRDRREAEAKHRTQSCRDNSLAHKIALLH
jgi:hypothetical protein